MTHQAPKYPLPKHMEEAPPLTKEEVDLLEDGVTVWIVWTGGNGWHSYVIFRSKYNITYAMTELEFKNYNGTESHKYFTHRELDFIGDASPRTVVKLDKEVPKMQRAKWSEQMILADIATKELRAPVGTIYRHQNGSSYRILSYFYDGEHECWGVLHRAEDGSEHGRSIENFFGELNGAPRFTLHAEAQ